MDGAPGMAGGGAGGPAPFLLKTYEMVDNPSTNEIVSWSPSSRSSFVVWNPPEFARLLLPTYFKHSNFSSFIRQLNTYGFRKSDPERWEFTNEDFVKDQKHLLMNIHRRKPIHSHSHPPGSTIDPERAAFEEEIDKLFREKSALDVSVLKFKQQQSAAKLQLQDLSDRIGSMEKRQEYLLNFLDKAVRNPDFVEQLARKLESLDFSAYNKKRRLPQVDDSQSVPENSFAGTHSSSRSESGNIFHQDFSNKLRLELSPAVSDINVVSHSTQSSNEDGGSPLRRLSEGCTKDGDMRTGRLLYAPDTLELSDTGTSFSFKKDSYSNIGPRLHSLQQRLASNEEADGIICCQLNLSLASSSVQVNKSQNLGGISQIGQGISNAQGNVLDFRVSFDRCIPDADVALTPQKERLVESSGPAATRAPVNDVFWEQFLTDKTNLSDNEETSSTLMENSDEQEDRRLGHRISRNAKSMERLTL